MATKNPINKGLKNNGVSKSSSFNTSEGKFFSKLYNYISIGNIICIILETLALIPGFATSLAEETKVFALTQCIAMTPMLCNGFKLSNAMNKLKILTIPFALSSLSSFILLIFVVLDLFGMSLHIPVIPDTNNISRILLFVFESFYVFIINMGKSDFEKYLKQR